jgi:alpha/beta superfamily hydrolase
MLGQKATSLHGGDVLLNFIKVGGEIEPFYFGEPEKQLFGCYHAPRAEPSRDCGAILCYPMGHEYMQFHRAYRQLGLHLSRAGFPVLRFDFFGCGDSAGNGEEGKIHQWLADISSAIGEMKRRSHVVKVCLVGFRLGGTLSMIQGAGREDIEGMVLWDPVVNGTAYVKKLRTLHQKMLKFAHVKQKGDTKGGNFTEILGFPFPQPLLVEVEKLDLLSIQTKPADNILVIQSDEEADQKQLKNNLENMHARIDFLHYPAPHMWTWIEDFGKVVVPYEILQSVVSWMCEAYP